MGGAALRAGLAYFAILFATGFLVGTVRVLLIEPQLGPVASVLIELPLMLALSWFVARRLIARFDPSASVKDRIVMGSSAVLLLVCAEMLLGALAFGMSATEQLARYATPRGVLTLVGQVGFALIPVLAGRK